MKKILTKGSIVWVNLRGNEGSEQGGVRPCIVISNDIGNKFSPVVTVAVITSKLSKAKLPTHVEVGIREGLKKDSIILCEQIRTIDETRIGDCLGKISKDKMKELDKAINVSLALGEAGINFMSLVEKTAIKKAKLVYETDGAIRLMNEMGENLSLTRRYIQLREDRLNELEYYCRMNKLNYRDYYSINEYQLNIAM